MIFSLIEFVCCVSFDMIAEIFELTRDTNAAGNNETNGGKYKGHNFGFIHEGSIVPF